MPKLTASAVKAQRELMLSEQGGACALCMRPCSASEAVLDHCHRTGFVRAVLHRGCNSMLGVIENNRPRYLLPEDSKLHAMLSRAVPYIQRNYSMNPVHPLHKTDDEKRLLKNKRAKKARAAKKATA